MFKLDVLGVTRRGNYLTSWTWFNSVVKLQVLKAKYAQMLLRESCRERKENICEDSAFVCVKLSWFS